MLDSLTPVDPTDQAPTHALFGIASEEAPVANGPSGAHANQKTNQKKKNKHKKSDGDKKKKRKKKKSKGKRKQRSD